MSKPKRHHFVPQFYLRRFSGGRRFLRCFHKKSKSVIPIVSIRDQCAIDNFYAWHDAIEWSLGIIESRAADILREIDQKLEFPSESFRWQELLIFIALQSSRTQLSGRESDDMADYYFKLLHEHEAKERGIDLSEFRIGSQFPAALPMQVAMQAVPELNNLDRCLLVNNSKIPFLASDNPVIFYNSRYSCVDYTGTIGLTCEGLQIFWPISSALMIMLYDPDSYKTVSNRCSKVLRESDVIQLNLLHYLWSGEVIFWKNDEIDRVVQAISDRCEEYLPYERSINRESEQVDLEDGTVGGLLHTWRAHAPIETSFQFVRASGSSVPSGNLIRGSNPGPIGDSSRRYVFAAPEPRRQLRGVDLLASVRAISNAARHLA